MVENWRFWDRKKCISEVFTKLGIDDAMVRRFLSTVLETWPATQDAGINPLDHFGNLRKNFGIFLFSTVYSSRDETNLDEWVVFLIMYEQRATRIPVAIPFSIFFSLGAESPGSNEPGFIARCGRIVPGFGVQKVSQFPLARFCCYERKFHFLQDLMFVVPANTNCCDWNYDLK